MKRRLHLSVMSPATWSGWPSLDSSIWGGGSKRPFATADGTCILVRGLDLISTRYDALVRAPDPSPLLLLVPMFETGNFHHLGEPLVDGCVCLVWLAGSHVDSIIYVPQHLVSGFELTLKAICIMIHQLAFAESISLISTPHTHRWL